MEFQHSLYVLATGSSQTILVQGFGICPRIINLVTFQTVKPLYGTEWSCWMKRCCIAAAHKFELESRFWYITNISMRLHLTSLITHIKLSWSLLSLFPRPLSLFRSTKLMTVVLSSGPLNPLGLTLCVSLIRLRCCSRCWVTMTSAPLWE